MKSDQLMHHEPLFLVNLLIMEPDCHHMLTTHCNPLALAQLRNHSHRLCHLRRNTPTLRC